MATDRLDARETNFISYLKADSYVNGILMTPTNLHIDHLLN